VSTPPYERVLPLTLLTGCGRASSRTASERPETLVSALAEDHELMVQLRTREAKALEILFDRYSRLVFTISLRILRDYGEAEDAVQDTFLYLYRSATLFDPAKGSAKAWIVQVAYHRALDRKSRMSRAGLFLGTKIDFADDMLIGATDLDREIGTRLDRARLERAFAELPEVQRRTLEMFYFDGLELREIAEKLNESLGNVRHYHYRGLERLRNSVFVGSLWKDKAK
jgi:RNA polymerase sigma-70 factor (ECF subfamily)